MPATGTVPSMVEPRVHAQDKSQGYTPLSASLRDALPGRLR